MNPQDIPFLLCGTLCLLPFAAGLTGWFIPFLFAKRLPFLQIKKWMEKGHKHIQMELSLETRETVKAMKKPEKPE